MQISGSVVHALHKNVWYAKIDGQSSFFSVFVKYGSIVAKDWYLFTCCFYDYHVIKKDITFCFFFFLFKFEIVRQINAFGKPDLFF